MDHPSLKIQIVDATNLEESDELYLVRMLVGDDFGETAWKHREEPTVWNENIEFNVVDLKYLVELQLCAAKSRDTPENKVECVGRGVINVSAAFALASSSAERTVTMKRGTVTAGLIKLRFTEGDFDSGIPISRSGHADALATVKTRRSSSFRSSSSVVKPESGPGTPVHSSPQTPLTISAPASSSHAPTTTTTTTTNITGLSALFSKDASALHINTSNIPSTPTQTTPVSKRKSSDREKGDKNKKVLSASAPETPPQPTAEPATQVSPRTPSTPLGSRDGNIISSSEKAKKPKSAKQSRRASRVVSVKSGLDKAASEKVDKKESRKSIAHFAIKWDDDKATLAKENLEETPRSSSENSPALKSLISPRYKRKAASNSNNPAELVAKEILKDIDGKKEEVKEENRVKKKRGRSSSASGGIGTFITTKGGQPQPQSQSQSENAIQPLLRQTSETQLPKVHHHQQTLPPLQSPAKLVFIQPSYTDKEISSKLPEIQRLMSGEVDLEFLIHLKKQLKQVSSSAVFTSTLSSSHTTTTTPTTTTTTTTTSTTTNTGNGSPTTSVSALNITSAACSYSSSAFASSFLAQDGYIYLITHLTSFPSEPESIHTTIISILKEALTDKNVYEHVIVKSRGVVGSLVLATKTPYNAVKAGLYALLANIATFGEKFLFKKEIKTILQNAFSYYKYMTNERRRFLDLMDAVRFEPSAFTQTAVLKLINSMINLEIDFFSRNYFRDELLSVGIESVFDEIEQSSTGSLKEQINTFKKRHLEDALEYKKIIKQEEEIASEFIPDHRVTKDNFAKLYKQTTHLVGERVSRNQHLMPVAYNIMKNLSCLSLNGPDSVTRWLLASQVIQQMAADKTVIKVGLPSVSKESDQQLTKQHPDFASMQNQIQQLDEVPKIDLRKLQNSTQFRLSQIFTTSEEPQTPKTIAEVTLLAKKEKELEQLRAKIYSLEDAVANLTIDLHETNQKLLHTKLRNNIAENAILNNQKNFGLNNNNDVYTVNIGGVVEDEAHDNV